MSTFFSRLLANKHTSGAALAYLAIELGQQIACTWFPQHADHIYETSRQLSKGVVGYGLIMAGDAKPTPPQPPEKPLHPDTG